MDTGPFRGNTWCAECVYTRIWIERIEDSTISRKADHLEVLAYIWLIKQAGVYKLLMDSLVHRDTPLLRRIWWEERRWHWTPYHELSLTLKAMARGRGLITLPSGATRPVSTDWAMVLGQVLEYLQLCGCCGRMADKHGCTNIILYPWRSIGGARFGQWIGRCCHSIVLIASSRQHKPLYRDPTAAKIAVPSPATSHNMELDYTYWKRNLDSWVLRTYI